MKREDIAKINETVQQIEKLEQLDTELNINGHLARVISSGRFHIELECPSSRERLHAFIKAEIEALKQEINLED
jgi:hypothetical protein